MKLVRDKYLGHNGFVLRPVKDLVEHCHLLEMKVREEIEEFLTEEDSYGAGIEAGDVIEAVMAMAKVKWGLSEEEVMKARSLKNNRLGGFTEGKVWVEG